MTADPRAHQPLHRALGLTDDEYGRVVEILGREPNHLELAMYAVMWSEHCSYKSSRIHLRRLPTEGDRVLVGPGENAGVIDAGDGIAVAIRIESHNHPSAIEPYQGAATGVGGILRDIFTMGARPLALMDPLFFGPLDDARQRWLFEGVVSGISGYGNSVGVPTVGGELTFDPSYAGNPLVNVLCLGALPVERLVLGTATGEGNLAVLLGSSTGRDGIGGVSVLASAGFESDDTSEDAKRPSVQVGDPFEEKRLIEACLELINSGLVVGVQDLGGAGLACATSETAGRGGMGMDVDVRAVALREPGMEPWEIMTSESQERMLAIVTPQNWPRVREICTRWEVRATVIGNVTSPTGSSPGEPPTGRLRILDGFDGPVLADVPAASLADDAPLYRRPMNAPNNTHPPDDDPDNLPAPPDCGKDLSAMLSDSEWVYRQYDHQLFLNTVVGPGGDAALLRLRGPGLPPSDRAIAVSTDSNPRWCTIDPRAGTAMTVAEGLSNLACVGATGHAVVNCLNFGNPEHPEVMWQLSECVDGLADACTKTSLAVVGGNVSFYNESGGVDISPTPVIAVLGLVDVLRRPPPGVSWHDGDSIVLLSPADPSNATRGDSSLGGTLWGARHEKRYGTLPQLDLGAHLRVVNFVRNLVTAAVAGDDTLLSGVHDVSSGGLALALAEFAVRSDVGCTISGVTGHRQLFNESPSRFVVATPHFDDLANLAHTHRVSARLLGTAGGPRFVIDGSVDLDLVEMKAASKTRIPASLGLPTEPLYDQRGTRDFS